MTSGIYEIVNQVNGKRYIGSASNIDSRWKRHTNLLSRNTHHSTHLQRAWNKCGCDSFVFSILLICSTSDLLLYEQVCIDRFIPEYNVCPVAGNSSGVIRSKEYREKQSQSQRGKIISQETRDKISIGMKGIQNSLGVTHITSQETRDKISNTLFSHPVSEETRKKLSDMNAGYKHTEEAKAKIAAASLGNTYASFNHTEDMKEHQKQKMLEYWKKRKEDNAKY